MNFEFEEFEERKKEWNTSWQSHCCVYIKEKEREKERKNKKYFVYPNWNL
jgi:hypothetical protein